MRHLESVRRSLAGSGYPWLVVALVVLLGLSISWGQTPPPGKDKKTTGRKDVVMCERLLAARKEYQRTLEELRAYYIATSDLERARWAEEELLQFHRIAKQAFCLDLDVGPPTLKPEYNLPAANELYRRAMGYKDKGWATDYTDNQRRAELLFQEILSTYPQSDKISDTAYQLGDIYESRGYKQYSRAAAYFERCFEWNPHTHFDARLRAARLYDRVLNKRDKATEIYQKIVDHETDERRREEALRRLTELGARR
jgi:hypothetical protein